jgi:tRNA pseudouridine13 synthase
MEKTNSLMFDLDFLHAFPVMDAQADFRSEAGDFFVDEELGFELTGNGEHLCLRIEKHDQNTVWVAKKLAEWADIQQMDVGYCGLKDRHAVTRQWFSLYLGKKTAPPLASLQIDGCNVIASGQHDKKFRRGMHASNRFIICLRNVTGDQVLLTQRWLHIAQQGVPNYFGEQRFGFDGSNLQRAVALADAHARVWREHKNQFAVSAVRSYLFNQVLAARLREQNWLTLLEGEPASEPTAPLWGRGRLASQHAAQIFETQVLEPFANWREKLEHLGLQQERRSLRLQPDCLSQQWHGNDWTLEFSLPPGTYATSVLRELCALRNIARHNL